MDCSFFVDRPVAGACRRHLQPSGRVDVFVVFVGVQATEAGPVPVPGRVLQLLPRQSPPPPHPRPLLQNAVTACPPRPFSARPLSARRAVSLQSVTIGDFRTLAVAAQTAAAAESGSAVDVVAAAAAQP